jgi:integrase
MAGERLGCSGVDTDLSRDEFPSLLESLLRRQESIMLEAKEAVETSWTLPLKLVVVTSPSEERLDLRDGVSGRRDRDRLSFWKLLVRTIKACGTTGEVQNGLVALAALMGHESLDTTRRYVQRTPEQLEAASERMGF